MGHGRYWTQRMDRFQDEKNPESRPRRARRNERKDQRTKDRLKALQIGFVQEKRANRWAVRNHGDPLLYSLYEHIFDLAKFRGHYRGRALIYFWELAQDLRVNCATVSRKVRRLEDWFYLGRRAKSDVFRACLALSATTLNRIRPATFPLVVKTRSPPAPRVRRTSSAPAPDNGVKGFDRMQQANLHTRLARDVKTASSTLSAKWAAPHNVILITTSKPTTKSRTMRGLPCRIQLQKRLGRKSWRHPEQCRIRAEKHGVDVLPRVTRLRR